MYFNLYSNKIIVLYSTWNSAQYHVAAWMGVGFGGEGYTCVWLSPFTVHLKLTALLISYTPIQNKKFRSKKQKDYK